MPSEDNKRIAKNSFFLYFRMGVIMLMKLYIARVLLETLGVADYGIWSLIFSFVISFQFISSPIVVSTQRFLNYDMGRGGKNLNSIFNLSLELIAVVGFIMVAGLEATGDWIINHKLNFPSGSLPDVKILYQLTIFSLLFQLLQKPFESVIIAHEKMSIYAYLSLFEATFLLVITLLLKSSLIVDKLIWYGALNLTLYGCVFLTYTFFCYSRFNCCKIKFSWDKRLAKDIVVFSGWNLFGGLASMTANQGVNILLNMFFGVTVNAAFGISQQVRNAVHTVVINLQKAFDPQIVKNYSSGNTPRLQFLTINVLRLAFVLSLAMVFPLIFNCEYILSLWIGNNIPEYTYWFCVLTLVQVLFVAIGAPVDTVIFSTGKIKGYQLWLSGEIFLNVIFTFILFKLHFDPVSTFVVRIIVEVIIVTTRFMYLKRIGLRLTTLIARVVCPLLLITLVSCVPCTFVFTWIQIPNSFARLLLSTSTFLAILSFMSWCLLLDKSAKKVITDKISRFFHQHKQK